MERAKRRRLATLAWRPDTLGEVADEDEVPFVASGPGIRTSMYPAVPIDAKVVEWFMKQSGNSCAMMFDINYVLLDYIAAQEKLTASKKPG